MGHCGRVHPRLESRAGTQDDEPRDGLFAQRERPDAHVEITIFFSDREPAGPYKKLLPARRTLHLRFNDLDDPEPIPHETNYASLIESDVPIVVQHTRLDSRQAENALITTIAYAGE